jgi:hypothetical protein
VELAETRAACKDKTKRVKEEFGKKIISLEENFETQKRKL